MSANSSHQQQANRLSCKQRYDASRTDTSLSTDTRSFPASRTNAGSLPTFSRSLSTITTDTGSFPAPRTNTGSLPTFSGSLPTSRTDGRTVPSREIADHDVSTKKMKVEVDDIEFENDFDSEVMMMMAQTTEMQNACHSSSSSSRVAGDWTAASDSSRCNSSATNAVLMSKTLDGSRRDLTETTSRTASDSAISYSSMCHNITGSRQSDNAERQGFIDREIIDVKDEDIMDVKHYSITNHNAADGDARYHCGSVAMPTYSASTGKCTTELVFSYQLSCVFSLWVNIAPSLLDIINLNYLTQKAAW